jgi:S-adenosylmethionine synthetase
MVFGEINSKAQVSYEQIVRQAIKEVGYDDIKKGMDYKNCTVMVNLDVQSPEIFNGIRAHKNEEDLGAGD